MTAALCAKPDIPTPAMSAASSAPTDAPTATPTPLMIWVTKRSRRVRRCTAATATASSILFVVPLPLGRTWVGP
jgi:hypothetical protein